MGKTNWSRVILGGLLAGLVFNVGETILNAVVLAEQMEELRQTHNLPQLGGVAVGVFVLLGFLTGIVIVWLYAAIRPRLGPGPRTVAVAGLVVWFLVYFFSSVSMVTMGMWSVGPAATAMAWGLVELLLAAVAGAWLYKET